MGLATVKRDKYSVFNFLNFSNPSEPAAWDRSTQDSTPSTSANQNQASGTNQNQDSSETRESVVDKALNKGKAMKSIFSHLMATENETQKATKPVSFQVKSSSANKKKEFKSIFSHLDEEQCDKAKEKISKSVDDKTGGGADGQVGEIISSGSTKEQAITDENKVSHRCYFKFLYLKKYFNSCTKLFKFLTKIDLHLYFYIVCIFVFRIISG